MRNLGLLKHATNTGNICAIKPRTAPLANPNTITVRHPRTCCKDSIHRKMLSSTGGHLLRGWVACAPPETSLWELVSLYYRSYPFLSDHNIDHNMPQDIWSTPSSPVDVTHWRCRNWIALSALLDCQWSRHVPCLRTTLDAEEYSAPCAPILFRYCFWPKHFFNEIDDRQWCPGLIFIITNLKVTWVLNCSTRNSITKYTDCRVLVYRLFTLNNSSTESSWQYKMLRKL
jgi:hypothetical protein